MKRQARRNKSKKQQQKKRKEIRLQKQNMQKQSVQEQRTTEKLSTEGKSAEKKVKVKRFTKGKEKEPAISVPVKELLKHIWKDNKLVEYIKTKISKPKELIGDQGVAETWDVVGFLVTTVCSFITFLFIILGILAVL